MSLLRQNPSEEIDDAALGEEFTKGSSHVVWATAVAVVVVSLTIGLYFYFGEHKPLASGDIAEVWVHPLVSTTPGVDANGAAQAQDTFEHVLVFVHAKIDNDSDKPLFLYRIETNATLPDGIHTSYAATKADYDRVFIAYPELVPYHGQGLAPDATIEPWKQVEGTFVSSFRVSKKEWDARKDLGFSFDFRYQPSLKLAPHSAVTER